MRVPTSLLFDQNIRTIMNNQRGLAQTQESLATGKRINAPSDDPVGAAKVIRLTESIDKLEQYQRNSDLFRGNLEQQEVILRNLVETGQRTRVLAIQSGNGGLDPNDRQALASEVEQLRDEIFDLMNTQNANGEYLFGGFQSQSQPYVFNPASTTNTFAFQGDNGVNTVKLSDSVELQSSSSGFDVFESALARFQFDLSGSTGTAAISSYNITQQSSFDQFYNNNYDTLVPANNEFRFTVNGAGNQVTVTNVGTGAAFGTLPFNSGGTVTFAGTDFTIDAAPGESVDFTLRAPEKRNIAQTVHNLALALKDTTIATTELRRQLADAVVGIDKGMEKIEREVSSIGGRLNAAESILDTNFELEIAIKKARSEVEDTDFAEASIELAKQETALEAALATFPRIANLSLFNFI